MANYYKNIKTVPQQIATDRGTNVTVPTGSYVKGSFFVEAATLGQLSDTGSSAPANTSLVVYTQTEAASSGIALVPAPANTKEVGGFNISGEVVKIGESGGNCLQLSFDEGSGTYLFNFSNNNGAYIDCTATGHLTLGGLDIDIFTNSGEPVVFNSPVRLGNTGPIVQKGNGSPEGSKTAPVGSLYLREDGGAGTSMYVKETGAGNTGWVAK